MRKITKRSAAIIAASVIAVGGGAAAWAGGWLAKGTATGTASTSDIIPISATVSLGAAKIYPGISTTATATVNNPNDFNVILDVAPGAPTFSAKKLGDGSNNTDCSSTLNASVVHLGAPTGSNIIKQKGSGTITIPVTVDESLSDKCAGSELKMTMEISGHSTTQLAPGQPSL